jgi:glycolate oxidase FAD binding subunit
LTVQTHAPESPADAARLLESCNDKAQPVRFSGGGTKMNWGEPDDEESVGLSSCAMADVAEHNAGDLTTIVGAGVPLAQAQQVFSRAGQMLALDPPTDDRATIGGVMATNDSGPLRHRYGALRDLILGVTVVLADGTIAKSGGKVIKNVAGYDLGKLFTGAFGTLGFVAEVALRLHPLPPRTLTMVASLDDPERLGHAASAVAQLPVELDCLDFSWSGGSGRLLARLSGAAPEGRAEVVAGRLRGLGLEPGADEDDGGLWEEQRAGQRSAEKIVLRIAGVPAEIARLVLVAERHGASVVGRAGLGVAWVTLDGGDDAVGIIEDVRSDLRPFACVLTDAPLEVRRKVGVWEPPSDNTMTLFRRIKDRFDPNHICNRGIYVGGI